jgi:uncharacterized protein (DUF362 family)
MDPLVIVSKGKDPYETTREALRADLLPRLDGKRVLVKPNAARLAAPGQGVTTHPLVVKAVIDHLREAGVENPVMGESCIFGVKAEEAFRVTGMEEVAARTGVKLIDLDREAPAEMVIPTGRIVKKRRVPARLRTFDFIVSIPVMKTHMHTQVTLSIKNMKGLLWRREKARFHQLQCDEEVTEGEKELDLAISDMASVLLPHLTVIDGIVGMEGMGPAYGKTKEMGVIVVGRQALSADATAARLMGFDPESVPHLRLTARRNLGEIQSERIRVEPPDWIKWQVPFNPPPVKLSVPFRDIVVHDEGSCSACLSTLLVFLQNYHSQLTDYRLPDRNVHVGIGRHLKACPKGTIFIGNCTSRMKAMGRFIRGCPPVASDIVEALKGKQSFGGAVNQEVNNKKR